MTRYLFTILSEAHRPRALQLVAKSPLGTRIEFKAEKRSMPQNDKMWAMLTEVALQVKWHGERLRPADWKMLFLDALDRDLRTVPNLDGDGFVHLGQSSSDLTKSEMGDLLELISAWGAQHNVEFKDVEAA